MSHSLWLLTAACLASGVDPVPMTDATGPAKSPPTVVTGTLACQGCPTPCEQKGCGLMERLQHRWHEACHTDCKPCSAPAVVAAKPCDQPCAKPYAPVVKKACPAPCDGKPCQTPCHTITKACAPACPAAKPCDCAKSCTSRWQTLLKDLCAPPAGCTSCASPCQAQAKKPCDCKPCASPCRTPMKRDCNPCAAPCQTVVRNPCQAGANPWEKPPTVLQPAAGPAGTAVAAPVLTRPPANAGPIMTSPYSPLPRILTKPEPVPAVLDVQVGKARARNGTAPARSLEAPARNFDAPAGRYDDVIQTSAISVAVPAQPEIARAYVSRTGCSPDYCRVTGQLSYVHTGGGVWVVRYASVDREDRYGGSVVLAPVVNMDSYKEGDLVTVTGEVLNDGLRASKFLGGPLYRATSVTLLDRQTRAAE